MHFRALADFKILLVCSWTA